MIEAGWLIRSVTGDDQVNTGDMENAADPQNLYNFALFPRSSGDPKRAYRIWKGIADGSSNSCLDFEKVIPYVVELQFVCFGINSGTLYDLSVAGANTDNADLGISYPNTGINADVTPLPTAIQINLTLLDKVSWNKWKALVGAANWASYVTDPDGNEPAGDDSRIFREKNQRKFTKMIYLGDKE